jgi:hypothetical protein
VRFLVPDEQGTRILTTPHVAVIFDLPTNTLSLGLAGIGKSYDFR